MNGVMSWVMCDGWRVSRCETKDNVNLIVLFYAHPRPLSLSAPPVRSRRQHHARRTRPRRLGVSAAVQGSAVVSRGLGNITNRLPGERCQDPLARGIFDAPRVGPAGRPGPPRRGAAPAPTLALSLWDTCGGEGVMTQVVTYRVTSVLARRTKRVVVKRHDSLKTTQYPHSYM